jgi:Arc/MetJ family transcription regulator
MTILVLMKTTMNLDADLVRRAKEMTGIEQTTAVVHEGLRALIAREAARRLAALGGSEPALRAPRRRRTA